MECVRIVGMKIKEKIKLIIFKIRRIITKVFQIIMSNIKMIYKNKQTFKNANCVIQNLFIIKI